MEEIRFKVRSIPLTNAFKSLFIIRYYLSPNLKTLGIYAHMHIHNAHFSIKRLIKRFFPFRATIDNDE